MKVYIYNFYIDVFLKTQYSVEKTLVNFNEASGVILMSRKRFNGYFSFAETNKIKRSGFFLSLRELSKNEIRKLGSHWRRLN